MYFVQRGDIHIRVSLKYFWGAVLERATEIEKELPRSHRCRRAKVDEANVETLVNDDVFVFNVSVQDVL